MKEINWNDGYYREGGTIIHHGQVKTIKHLETDVFQNSSSIFDRKSLLRITTVDGKVIESIGR
jgi:hypothetical protein